jgi:hypothetical protein
MKSWLCVAALVAAFGFAPQPAEAGIGGLGDDDSVFTLVLLQMIQQRKDPLAMQSLYPLLLSNLMGKKSGNDMTKYYYLLLGAGNDPNMQQWLPLILNNGNKDTSDKLLMLIFMQQNQVTGNTGMGNMFPLLLLNANDDKYCKLSTGKCNCKTDNSEMILYMMLMSGSNVGRGNPYGNFMFMLFDDKKCEGKLADKSSCTCGTSDKIEGGIDAVTYMMLMMMNPVAKRELPSNPPARSIDVKDLLKQQLFANLGEEYRWMANVNDAETADLVKFQLYQQMGIPPNVMSLLSNGGAKSSDERFALIQWMSQGSQLSIETMSLMLGIEDAKQFYVHSMIEQGEVDPMTASMLLASVGDVDKGKMKEMLILAATGQVDPETFATIARPYVPQLPQGIFPGQDLYFIHLELLDLNTCAMIEPHKRKACGKNFGTYITAEQCEVHPYCCYNPYFGKVNSVPWCYYNIFFVFHDQYKLRVKEADKFKGPQDCPGLFRYGLPLDPFMYYKAVADLGLGQRTPNADSSVGSYLANQVRSGVLASNTKLGKLIHYRRDVGFAGITEFHCRAILGACWDGEAAQYPATYRIPQCYEEANVEFAGGQSLHLYDPKLFKPKVPTQFVGAEGECDTNYFHISTLYYKRRACTYSIDMIKYGTEFSPLNEPSRDDCLFRLGCCFEDNDEVLAQYEFLPRCYHRVKDEVLDDRLYEYDLVYNRLDYNTGELTQFNAGGMVTGMYDGARVCVGNAAAGTDGITRFIDSLVALSTVTGFTRQNFIDGYATKHQLSTKPQHAVGATGAFRINDLTAFGLPEVNPNDVCLYKRKSTFGVVRTPDDFWEQFDIFDKRYLIENEVPKSNIPVGLRDMMKDLF